MIHLDHIARREQYVYHMYLSSEKCWDKKKKS